LIFQPSSIDSRWFRYDYVRGANGGIIGCRATALSDMGNFVKGNFLQTTYRASDDGFTHCTGGSNANEAFGTAKSLVPNFFNSDGSGVCQ